VRKAAFDQLVLLKQYGVSKASRLSGFPKSSYYYRPAQHADRRKPRLDLSVLHAVENEVMRHPSYGVRRVTAMLRRSGIVASRKKVYRLMKLAGLVRKASVRKHVIVKRFLTVPERPDQLWQQDITYIWCGQDGWCYLFSMLDCFTREWLSYTFSTQCGTDEAIKTLEMAVLERFPDGAVTEGLATRSDGGSQYTSDRFISTLKVYGIKQELTGKNRPDQNAYIEAFHRSLKEDCIWQHDFQTFHEADAAIRQFFYEYNWDRPHSSLKYMTPKEFYAAYGGTG
jgi:putative transposase